MTYMLRIYGTSNLPKRGVYGFVISCTDMATLVELVAIYYEVGLESRRIWIEGIAKRYVQRTRTSFLEANSVPALHHKCCGIHNEL